MDILVIIRIGIFLVLSSSLLVFTLKRPHLHRWYRFLAFECILVLIFLQVDRWFIDPFSPRQILSWLMLTGSLPLALHGFYLLRSIGEPDQDIENTTILVTQGAYRYIRHPLYASLLVLGIGAALKGVTTVVAIVVVFLFVGVYGAARVEEQSNLDRFGEQYRRYMQQTKMFIPWIW